MKNKTLLAIFPIFLIGCNGLSPAQPPSTRATPVPVGQKPPKPPVKEEDIKATIGQLAQVKTAADWQDQVKEINRQLDEGRLDQAALEAKDKDGNTLILTLLRKDMAISKDVIDVITKMFAKFPDLANYQKPRPGYKTGELAFSRVLLNQKDDVDQQAQLNQAELLAIIINATRIETIPIEEVLQEAGVNPGLLNKLFLALGPQGHLILDREKRAKLLGQWYEKYRGFDFDARKAGKVEAAIKGLWENFLTDLIASKNIDLFSESVKNTATKKTPLFDDMLVISAQQKEPDNALDFYKSLYNQDASIIDNLLNPRVKEKNQSILNLWINRFSRDKTKSNKKAVDDLVSFIIEKKGQKTLRDLLLLQEEKPTDFTTSAYYRLLLSDYEFAGQMEQKADFTLASEAQKQSLKNIRGLVFEKIVLGFNNKTDDVNFIKARLDILYKKDINLKKDFLVNNIDESKAKILPTLLSILPLEYSNFNKKYTDSDTEKKLAFFKLMFTALGPNGDEIEENKRATLFAAAIDAWTNALKGSFIQVFEQKAKKDAEKTYFESISHLLIEKNRDLISQMVKRLKPESIILLTKSILLESTNLEPRQAKKLYSDLAGYGLDEKNLASTDLPNKPIHDKHQTLLMLWADKLIATNDVDQKIIIAEIIEHLLATIAKHKTEKELIDFILLAKRSGYNEEKTSGYFNILLGDPKLAKILQDKYFPGSTNIQIEFQQKVKQQVFIEIIAAFDKKADLKKSISSLNNLVENDVFISKEFLETIMTRIWEIKTPSKADTNSLFYHIINNIKKSGILWQDARDKVKEKFKYAEQTVIYPAKYENRVSDTNVANFVKVLILYLVFEQDSKDIKELFIDGFHKSFTRIQVENIASILTIPELQERLLKPESIDLFLFLAPVTINQAYYKDKSSADSNPIVEKYLADKASDQSIIEAIKEGRYNIFNNTIESVHKDIKGMLPSSN